MKITLCCMAGMSTSLLVKKMSELVDESVFIEAVPLESLNGVGSETDILLLGPQIAFRLDEVKGKVTVPVMAIPMVMYGMMDAKGVLALIKEELPADKKELLILK